MEPESTGRKLLKTGLVLSGTTLIDFSPLSWVISSSFHQPVQTPDLNHLASSENMAEIIVYLACKHMKIYLSKSPHVNGATLISRLFEVNRTFWGNYNKIKLDTCCTCLVNISTAILSFLSNKQKQNLSMQNADIKQPNRGKHDK